MRKINVLKLAKTLRLFQQQQEVTALQLATEVGVHLITAQSWLRQLRFNSVVHIAGWLPDSLGRDAIPIYRFGEGVDAERRKTSRSEINRRYLERKRESARNSA